MEKIYFLLFNLLVIYHYNFNSYCEGIYLNNVTENLRKPRGDNPEICAEKEGIWGPLLEEWALTGTHREKRVMQIPLTNYAYVTDEAVNTRGTTSTTTTEKESKINNNVGKIVNTNNGTNKRPLPPTAPPGRQVSETDLYLLGAIEKLVYKVDFMEKRLRRVEEMLYYVMAGNRIDQEPCPDNFTRAGSNCYFFSSNAGREFDWKVASKHCKKLGAALAEFETIEENQDIIAYIQSNSYLRGKDFWTGGLNPGLLWIWSNSARPVAAPSKGTAPTNNNNNNNNNHNNQNILGEGRCLRLAYNPASRSYSYKGTDCSIRYSYICEFPEQTSSNEISRIGRSKRILLD